MPHTSTHERTGTVCGCPKEKSVKRGCCCSAGALGYRVIRAGVVLDIQQESGGKQNENAWKIYGPA